MALCDFKRQPSFVGWLSAFCSWIFSASCIMGETREPKMTWQRSGRSVVSVKLSSIQQLSPKNLSSCLIFQGLIPYPKILYFGKFLINLFGFFSSKVLHYLCEIEYWSLSLRQFWSQGQFWALGPGLKTQYIILHVFLDTRQWISIL